MAVVIPGAVSVGGVLRPVAKLVSGVLRPSQCAGEPPGPCCCNGTSPIGYVVTLSGVIAPPPNCIPNCGGYGGFGQSVRYVSASYPPTMAFDFDGGCSDELLGVVSATYNFFYTKANCTGPSTSSPGTFEATLTLMNKPSVPCNIELSVGCVFHGIGEVVNCNDSVIIENLYQSPCSEYGASNCGYGGFATLVPVF